MAAALAQNGKNTGWQTAIVLQPGLTDEGWCEMGFRVGFGIGLGLALTLPLAALAQEACTTYTVKEGDTLGSIAQAAYGSFNYQMIFNANREAIADNPSNLPIGLQLILPCKDGRLTADTTLNAVIDAETEKQEASSDPNRPYLPAVRFVTANDWKPFADESLSGGGIYVRMAETAM